MDIFQLLFFLCTFFMSYFLFTAALSILLANIPRRPVHEIPEWGEIRDYLVPTINGKKLECWVIYPEKFKGESNESVLKSNPAILLFHGWGRNRDSMVTRARIYGNYGYTTILPSARDHGNSDKEILGMSIVRFSEDLESCIEWWGKPVIINGHSISAGAALIVAARNKLVKGVISEATPYAFPHSLKYVYYPILRWLTPLLMPGITVFTKIKYRNYSKEDYSPYDAASRVTIPTLLIHGEKDEIFPHEYTTHLKKRIEKCLIWVPEGTEHSNIDKHPDYSNQVNKFLLSV
ncbi:MAG: alpha/beta hydrolase [Candidatus Hodarchaeales archaeon]|jgi:pimeloyl-ACP methyl ester carboxylesterase